MPAIEINPSYFVDLAQLPLPLMLLRLFLDGGWIFFLIVLIQGSWLLWVQSRQAKYGATLTYTLLAIDVPRMNEQTPRAMEQIFAHLSAAYAGLSNKDKYWHGKSQAKFSFELVSVEGYVQFLVYTQTRFRDLVEAAVYSQYPDSEIIEVADYTALVPNVYPHPEWEMFGTEYVLKKDQAYPIRSYTQFEHDIAEVPFSDPLSGILEIMGSLKSGEHLWMQILVTPNDDSWRNKSEKVVNKITGKKEPVKPSLFQEVFWLPIGIVTSLTGIGEGAPEKAEDKTPAMQKLTPGEKDVLEAVQQKATKIGFNTKIRIMYVGRRDVFSKGRLTQLRGAFGQFASLNMNGFKGYGPVTPKADYRWQKKTADMKTRALLKNYTKRSGAGATSYVLNTEELATLYHFPMITSKAPLVKKTDSKRGEPPVKLPTQDNLRGMPFQRIKKAPPPEAAPAEPPATPPEAGGPPSNLPFA